VDRGGAVLVDRLDLSLGNPFCGEPGAAFERLLQVAGRLLRDQLGLLLGMGDDRLGVACGLALLLLVLGEQRLGLVAQPARLVEFGGNAVGAGIEHARDRAAHWLPDRRDKNDEGDQYPEFGFGEDMHQWARSPAGAASVRSTAAAIRASSGAAPVSFSTTARPTSRAMPRTSAKAS